MIKYLVIYEKTETGYSAVKRKKMFRESDIEIKNCPLYSTFIQFFWWH
jgi:hypothetical protein